MTNGIFVRILRTLQTIIVKGDMKWKEFIFWNNKGGTGKTTLAFQLLNEYALQNRDKRILVIDVCPQANLSELLLGGLNQGGSEVLLMRQGANPRATIGLGIFNCVYRLLIVRPLLILETI